jgi:hypothetical protein
MKKTLFTLIFLMTSGFLFAQLANTRWKGTLKGDNPQEVIFDFRKDTAIVYTVPDSSHVESMTYTLKDMVLTLKKIDGISDCDATPGKYKLTMASDNFSFKLLEDVCNDRSSAIDAITLVKWKGSLK